MNPADPLLMAFRMWLTAPPARIAPGFADRLIEERGR